MPSRIALLSAVAVAAVAAAPTAAAAKSSAAKAHSVAQCANANLQVTTANRPLADAAVVCLINQQRVAHSLPALKVSTKLDHSAQGWSDSMSSNDTLSHGTNFAGRISAAGFKWTTAGENIASGFATPFTVVHAWMNDIGHCQNILRPTFGYVGTGLTVAGSGNDELGDWWTQDFGLPVGARSGSTDMGPADGCPYLISDGSTASGSKPTTVSTTNTSTTVSTTSANTGTTSTTTRTTSTNTGTTSTTTRTTSTTTGPGPNISW